MSAIDYGVIILYLLGMLAIGFWASKKVHTTDDFALGGRSIGPFFITCSCIATASGASTCLGQAGAAYTDGFSALWLVFAWSIGMLMLTLLAKRIYRTGAGSIPEVFRILHGNEAGRVCAVFAIIYCFSTLIAQMIGMGTVLYLMLGNTTITYELAIIIGGLVTIAYTLQGGFFAVAYTDTAQTIVLVISMIIVFPIVVLSGTAEVALETVEAVLTPGTFNLFYGVSFLSLAAIICKYTFAACTGIPYIQRVLASRNENEAQSSQVYATIGYTIFGSVVMVVAVYARLLYPNIEQPETISLQVIVSNFPVVLAGLGIAGLIAAVMSTIDSYLLVVSQIFSRDICGWLVKDMTPEKEFKIGRGMTVFAGLTTMLIALKVTSVLAMFELAATVYSSAVFFPFIFSLFWKKTTAKGVVAGMISGGSVAIILQFVPNLAFDPVIMGNVVSCIVTFTVSLATQRAAPCEE